MSRLRECGTKQRHTRAEAEAHKWSLVRAGAKPGRLGIYKCSHCGAFHVGHKKRGRR